MPGFRKVSERIVHQGHMISLAVGTFEDPTGGTFERDVVHHPGAVVVVPYDDASGEVVLVRQYRAPVDQELLEIPAGKRDVEGEPTEVTAARELAEEVGLRAGRLELVADFYNSPGFSDEHSYCYLARDLEPVANDLQGVEEQHLVVQRVPLAEVPALIKAGKIADGKTIIGLALAKELIG
jgi:8-oxo-dGTP pyrophosphatase MutT (NUDIX family)